MIDLELVKENKPVELELEENSKGGTKNYNELDNKPKINGVELQGDLTLEDLGIIVNAVKDILINGKTIIDENGNAIIPIADADNLGLVKVKESTGIKATNGGPLTIVFADENRIRNRNSQYNPLVPKNMDYAFKCAMTDGKGAEWSATEKANARARMGIDTWEEVADITIEEDVEYINIYFDIPYKELYAYVSQDNCETKLTGTKNIYPRLNPTFDTGERFGAISSYISLGSVYNDVVLVVRNHSNLWIEQHIQNLNAQKNTTTDNLKAKYVDTIFHPKLNGLTDLNFYGLYCNCTNKGTRIRVLGVRA